MKKVLTSVLCSVLLISIALLFTGCGGTADEGSVQESDGIYKVALVLSGPVNDGGWNSTGYRGVVEAQDKLGFDLAFTENVDTSSQEEVIRGYASEGYHLIIGHGFQFGDAAMRVAPSFPDTFFLITSSDQHVQEPNLACAQMNYAQCGFIAGLVGAAITETNKVGAISGEDMPPVRIQNEYFQVGAKYFNPDIVTRSAFTGSFEDIGKAKETALAFIEDGVDVISANVNQATPGVILAVQERDVYYIGLNNDQYELAPGNVVTSVFQNWVTMFAYLIEKGMAGEIEADYYELGINEGAVEVAPFREFEDKFDTEKKQKVLDLIEKIKNGELDPKDYEYLIK